MGLGRSCLFLPTKHESNCRKLNPVPRNGMIMGDFPSSAFQFVFSLGALVGFICWRMASYTVYLYVELSARGGKRAVSSRMECANIYEIEKESFPYPSEFLHDWRKEWIVMDFSLLLVKPGTL